MTLESRCIPFRIATCNWCAARKASVARVKTENVESPSPRDFNTAPPAPVTTIETSSSWRANATSIASGACSHNSVEATTSVSTNETTPVGNAPTTAFLQTATFPWSAINSFHNVSKSVTDRRPGLGDAIP